MKTTQISLTTYHDIPLNATRYTPDTTATATVFYLHGGGLEFGQRDDLPLAYIQRFVDAGIELVTFDYLLAPEVKVDVILPVLRESLQVMVDKLPSPSRIILMGRSAGAYLCYLLLHDGFEADGFIDLYGYSRLDYPEFRMPSGFYDDFPKVLPMAAQAMIQRQPLVAGEMKDRYPLYVSGRQFGTWLSQFLPSMRDAERFSLTPADLHGFPRTLLIHSTDDPDVPFATSTDAVKHLPDAKLIPVSQAEHDFDREVTPDNLAIYDQIIAFVTAATSAIRASA
ncbi:MULTISPECIES: alpha/beta hydrolase [Lactobacillaceae]|uniref:alpha/beta hydrolase n=1 Tax=Lactobacillaceae TaxID=33958 RepID=UPI001457719A|nr:alpha/beta hydrolase [Lactobacillus sp. HBUAS51381]NLR09368.1 alpha/beta hydrolase [Lactobacillus sp. HBUAS51381]